MRSKPFCLAGRKVDKDFFKEASMVRITLLALALLVPGIAVADPGIERGKAALEAARLAYQKAGAFQETFDYALEFPDGRKEPKRQEYGVGRAGEAFLILSGGGKEIMRFVAREGKAIGTQFNIADRYSETSYQGDFAASLRKMGGDQIHVASPPAVVARQGGDFAAFLDSLRLGILLPPLQIAGSRSATAEDGSAVVEVELRAANGTITVGLDPGSRLFRQVRLALGEGKQQVRAAGRYTLAAGGSVPGFPDLAGRTAVATFAEMEKGDYPLGQAAPRVTLRTLDGGTVRLADLQGSVVVLDFWATWCVPCWTALQHTSELAAWARSSGLPVQVFAVDTLESTESPEEQRRLVTEFLRAKKLDLPVLLDSGKETFAAFHNPGLPSLVIVGKDGRLARYYSGGIKDMTETIRGEVLELLK